MSTISIPTLRTWLTRWFSRRAGWTAIDGSDVLAKAANDTWEYAIGLKSGLLIQCASVNVSGEWLSIHGITRVENLVGQTPLLGNFNFGRGMEVRISEVAWAADCDS